MRILGTIDHPDVKITVFKMEERLSLKFENPLYEQTYKLGTDERFKSMDDIHKLVDEAFIQSVLQQFKDMHNNRLAALARAFPSIEQTDVFETIL